MYSEMIMRTIDDKGDYSIGGCTVNNIRYADDTTLIAHTPEKLQELLDTIVEESKNKGLTINQKKTFCMAISKRNHVDCTLKIEGDQIRQVEAFNYLGSTLTSDGRCIKEVKRRMAMAKEVFQRMVKLMKCRSLSMDTRIRVLNCYIIPVLVYGCESWTLTQALEKSLKATEMWMLRRMLRISWTERVTNDEVLRRAGYNRSLLLTIRRRQLSFLGHVIRKEGLEELALTGKVQGRKGRGRPRGTYMKSMAAYTNKSVVQLLRAAKDRDLWKNMTANVLREHGT